MRAYACMYACVFDSHKFILVCTVNKFMIYLHSLYVCSSLFLTVSLSLSLSLSKIQLEQSKLSSLLLFINFLFLSLLFLCAFVHDCSSIYYCALLVWLVGLGWVRLVYKLNAALKSPFNFI